MQRKKIWPFRQADGSVLSRATGYAILHAAGTETSDEVVFGESGDLVLLGARTLESMNLRVEPVGKRLVDAGPAPAAASAVRASVTPLARLPGPARFHLTRRATPATITRCEATPLP